MGKKNVLKKFNVWAEVKTVVTVQIFSDNLETALSEAKNLKQREFVSGKNVSVEDIEVKISGILEG